MRNVLTIASLEQTITSEPSSRRSRRCAPISTPSEDESMNVVSVRSTTTWVRPASIGAETRCLNSGAVKRSISPVTATTCVSPSTMRSSIEKAMAIGRCHPRQTHSVIPAERLVRRAGVLQPDMEVLAFALRRHAELVGELLDHVADPRDRGVDDERITAAGPQRADAQAERARAGLERDVDGAVQDMRGGSRRDQVGDQDGVVEPVQRQV